MASGALTSAALTGFYLQRIDRLNPALHAVITVNLEAPAEAAASDAARAARGRGVRSRAFPCWSRTTSRSPGCRPPRARPPCSPPSRGTRSCVSRLRAAGAVIIGKANLSEWANFRSTHSTSGWSTLGGQTANPYALDRNPSGSSSGSAAGWRPGWRRSRSAPRPTARSCARPAPAGSSASSPPTGWSAATASCRSRRSRTPRARWRLCVADAAALLSVLAAADPADPVSAGENDLAERAGADLGPVPLTRGPWMPPPLTAPRLGIWRDVSARPGPPPAPCWRRRWPGCARSAPSWPIR